MPDAVYKIVEHDGGWAYKLEDVFSETFPSRTAAEAAARLVAAEQRVPGEDEAISWQDQSGSWHDENESGRNRPFAYVAGEASGDEVGSARQGGQHGRAYESAEAPAGRGLVDQIVEAYDRTDQHTRRGARLARRETREHPLTAVLLAGACGYLLALATHSRR